MGQLLRVALRLRNNKCKYFLNMIVFKNETYSFSFFMIYLFNLKDSYTKGATDPPPIGSLQMTTIARARPLQS